MNANPHEGRSLDLFSAVDHECPPPRLDVPVFSVRLVRERDHNTA